MSRNKWLLLRIEKAAVDFSNHILEKNPLIPFIIPVILIAWAVERWLFSFSNWIPLALAVWVTRQVMSLWFRSLLALRFLIPLSSGMVVVLDQFLFSIYFLSRKIIYEDLGWFSSTNGCRNLERQIGTYNILPPLFHYALSGCLAKSFSTNVTMIRLFVSNLNICSNFLLNQFICIIILKFIWIYYFEILIDRGFQFKSKYFFPCHL